MPRADSKAAFWKWIWIGFVLGLPIAGFLVWFYLQPRTAEERLERAITAEANTATRIEQLKLTGTDENQLRAKELLGRTVAKYRDVTSRHAGTTESLEAHYRIWRLMDRETTDAAERVTRIDQFLREHPDSPHAIDMEWQAAELTAREMKQYLDGIKLYERYADAHPQDERAAEARFRTGALYEEIREFQPAVEAYRRVVNEHPSSKFAEEAQFRIATLLAERLERKKEAEREYAELEQKHPGGRYARAAAGERQKLADTAAETEREEYKKEYYGGTEGDDLFEHARRPDDPHFRRMREQPVLLVHEDVDITVMPGDGELTASVRALLVPREETTGTIVFDLGEHLKLTSITRNGADADFSRQADRLLLAIGDKPMQAGTTEVIEMAYRAGRGGKWDAANMTSSSAWFVRHGWLPRFWYDQRFSARVRVEVPTTYSAFTQGKLVEDSATDASRVFVYESEPEEHALAVGPYRCESAQHEREGVSIPLAVCLFEDTTPGIAQAYLSELPHIMDFFVERLGPFPYSRLTVAEVSGFPGGFSSPGLILMGSAVIGTTSAPAEFLAHEVSHAWFGNAIRVEVTEDSVAWLAEGFAQYWDALYHGHRSGREAFVRHMRKSGENYYAAVADNSSPEGVVEPNVRAVHFRDPMYATLAYEKGAFVLHALRGVMGDEKFFAAMRDYVTATLGRRATISEFQAAAERAHGESLDWFFTQWLDRGGMPRYRIVRALDRSSDGKYQVEIGIEQLNEPYRMPLDIEVETAAGAVRKRIDFSDKETSLTIETAAAPQRVRLDPDYWILKHPRHEDMDKAVTRP
jgi:aminopeptidase N